MKEQSWLANNLLPLSFVVLITAALTCSVVGLLHWASSAIRPSRQANEQVSVERRRAKESSIDANSPAQGVYGQYVARIEREIKSNWHPPKRNRASRVTVFFKVDRLGKLSNLKVSPAGDSELVKSARKAVEDTAPFGPFPSSSKDKEIEIKFTFDYNFLEKKSKLNR